MSKTLISSGLAAALLLAGAWAALRGTECRDVWAVCAWAETDGGVVESPSEVAVTVRGSDAPDGSEVDLPAVGKCQIVKLGAPYACSPLAAPVKQFAEQDIPPQGCACSDGTAGCERLDGMSGKWVAAKKSPEVMQPGQWRGTCVTTKLCSESETMISGVGAVNQRGYASDKRCGGIGKVPPPLPATKADIIK